ncbi:hypothetical protein C4J81_15465 [Deltaproteobacteria bacterium Smac51]|nr:hypothetical protein C4J81_10200 [Deltaproteobacteria bacterium Smac51]UQZ90529.1 hypothetical protein C4J81_15465 [Deltaproteobacteria bacterium Smac51]
MITPIITPPEIRTAHEANRALATLAEHKAELDLINGALTDAVSRAKRVAEMESALIISNVTMLEKALEEYAEANRDTIVNGKRKSLKLTCGRIGYKSQSDLVADDWDTVAEALAESEQAAYLIFKNPVADKKALAKLDDVDLAAWGIRREVTETFYAAPDVARVAGEGVRK